MTKELWLNIPVKDVQQSVSFFKALGFSFHSRDEGSTQMAGLIVGQKQSMIMLVEEEQFKKYSGNIGSSLVPGGELLISFDAGSREEVDEMAKKVKAAGGEIFGEPSEIQGWMYGMGFIDLDGHKWNILHMSA